jgi:hypothetical protein
MIAALVYKLRLTAVGIRYTDHATPSTRKGWHYFHRQAAVGIVRLRTTATEFRIVNIYI